MLFWFCCCLLFVQFLYCSFLRVAPRFGRHTYTSCIESVRTGLTTTTITTTIATATTTATTTPTTTTTELRNVNRPAWHCLLAEAVTPDGLSSSSGQLDIYLLGIIGSRIRTS
ncbi:unnamed protein product [Polarella glacialis]|uniref:Secreted protein n=1 Tax=Polarella glacialis TaxID=89957 RepID=A0A813KFB2_POLGL|nr:unnamed protein product [Polarella glacialis]